MKKFQTILLIIFGVGAILAVVIFAGYIPTPSSKSKFKGSGTVVIWGTENSADFVNYFTDLADGVQDFKIRYVAKDPKTYEAELVQAFADGNAPDLFFVTNDNVLKFNAQISPIAYNIMPQKTYLESFAPAFNVFLSPNGILAYPFLIDPMVFYYNKTLLANDGIALSPKYWDEITKQAEVLTKKDQTNAFLQSTISFGRFENNIHAKDIIKLLLLQVGNPIIASDGNGNYVSTLGTHKTSLGLSLPAVVTFFTDFASPDKFVYSWNKSLPDATSSFLTERVVYYVGFSSELFKLKERNPNLSLSLSEVPQPRGVNTKKTYARLTGIAMSRYSKNQQTAILTIQTISSPYHNEQLSKILSLPPIYLSDLKQNADPALAYQQTLQNAALRSISILDPGNSETTNIFKDLTQNILAGGTDAEGAYERADGSLSYLLGRFSKPLTNTSNDVTVPTGN